MAGQLEEPFSLAPAPAAGERRCPAGPPGPKPHRRFHELDSLRGLAALTVVFHHFLYLTSPRLKSLLLHGPFRVLIAGHEAVVLFFILSGFVLTLPYERCPRLNYASFLLKRLCRIYLPYLAALVLAVSGDLLTPLYLTGNCWINYTWSRPVAAHLVLQHVLFLGSYDWEQFNTAFWSLVYEMRISLVFPFIALAVLRLRTRWSLAAAFASSAAFFLLAPIASFATVKTLVTLHYAAFFILGGLLARNLRRIDAWFHRLSPVETTLLALAALLFYAPLHLPQGGRMAIPIDLYDWSTAAAALAFILLAMNAAPFHRFLSNRAVHHLGTVSYSLYLVHGTVLFILIHTCVGRVPMGAVFALYLALTFAAAELFYRLVERPAMLLGRRLTRSGT